MEDCAYGLSKRKVTISTSGVVPAIDRLKDFTDASLAISLHAPNDDLRSRIMPINKKYPISELLRSVQAYMDSLSDKRVPVIEYTMIKGVNDHRAHARELATLLSEFPCKINLIPFNPFSLSDYERPSGSSVTNFRQILQAAGYTVTVRTTRGEDIGAACGQLVGEVDDLTRRSSRHKRITDDRKRDAKIFDHADNLAVAADRVVR
jgi:23S rRNA (adenine2503-C2)-methyltransferase